MSDTTADRLRFVSDAPIATKVARLDSIDLMRGIVIVLMALDHVRDFFHARAWTIDPVNADQTDPALFLTRFVTHFCAPTFVFLAGTSAFLQRERKDAPALSGFLLTRGLWLILLEITVLNFAWNMPFGPYALGLQVIWAIGVSMIVLAGLVRLPVPAVLAIGVLIVAGHNLLDPVVPAEFGALAPLWLAAHEGGPLFGGVVFFVYPLLPWIGIMALGYGLGGVFRMAPERRARVLIGLGLAMLTAFAVLRGFNLFGDPRPWSERPELLRSTFDLFNVQKYPPSLAYVLVTLGPVFVLLPFLERAKGAVADFFLAFGRVPLFAYVMHVFLAHGLAIALAYAIGRQPWGITTGFVNPSVLEGWGYSLPVVYAVWALVILMLWPLCRWFAEIKRTRRDWWLSYL